jgi:hypothetical protein
MPDLRTELRPLQSWSVTPLTPAVVVPTEGTHTCAKVRTHATQENRHTGYYLLRPKHYRKRPTNAACVTDADAMIVPVHAVRWHRDDAGVLLHGEIKHEERVG